MKRDNTRFMAGCRVLMGILLLWAAAGSVYADEQSDVQDELKFASELVKWRFPDYAQKAMDRLLIKYPSAKAQASKVRIEVLTSRGKFEEAEALVAGMPAGATETMVMQLSIADQYYAWQRMKDAQRVYDAFFKQFPKGPPAEVAKLYGESAYKFAQMLVLTSDYMGAYEAYRRVLGCPLNASDIERRVMTEMAEIGLRVAENPATPAATRKAIIEESSKMCEKVQWQGTDLWFARTVVILAHIKLLDGDKAGARKVITDYMPMLVDVDKALREANESMKFSPMAECKFLLGTIYEDEGRALLSDKTKEAECVPLLARAMSQLYTVAKNYPGSNWAPEARRRADAIADVLERDLKKTITRPTFEGNTMMAEQLKEARLLYQQQDFKAAAAKYIEVLNLNERFPNAPAAISELARCYIELKDDSYARAMTGYLAERFGQTTNSYEDAGNALLGVAGAYEERLAQGKADQVYDLFYQYYPNHSKVPMVLFREGEIFLRSTNYVEGLKNYSKIVDTYTRARVYPDALSRQAYCLTMLGDHTNAIVALTNYVAQLSTSVEWLSAKFRLGDAYRFAGMTVMALNEYTRLIKQIEQDGANFTGGNADDINRMKRLQELAMYAKGQCYSRLREPEAQVPVYQAKAIESYEAFLKGFPKSDMGPSALGAMGTLYYLLNKPDEAGKAFDRLAKDYPASKEAMNMVFVRADSLMNMGETNRAVTVYADMLKNPAQFNASQFLRAGRVLAEANEFGVAVQLFAEACKSTEVPLWQAATVGYAQALMGAGKYAESIKVAEDFLKKYQKSGYVIDINLTLSRCHAELAKLEADAEKKKALFDKAFAAMSKVRQYARDPEMMIRADVEMAAIQLLMGDKRGALASYQRILLFTDASVPKVRPYVELVFDRSLSLFRETERFADMLEACETYLKQFPQGQFASKARQCRDEAKAKLAAGKK